ncbi:spermine oxidase-like [Contarinia nasturtii]|uniref:spermine oxidase-like n=1 Tax=Contarinia nasturtii TaxID=265458 RepID=UPI0012D40E35|nr:spermine oxidase-like [Contarinia nasturtii]
MFKKQLLRTMCEKIKIPFVYCYRHVSVVDNCHWRHTVVSVEPGRSHELDACILSTVNEMEKKIIKIIIIGAGTSGFAAASKLISNGFENVTILEAENRIGGRVHTIEYGANVLDMGAQWCHGEEGNVVYDMAKDKNLLSSNVPRYDSIEFVRSNGEKVPQNITDKLGNLMDELLDRDDKREEKSDYQGSFGNYIAERYFRALRSDKFNDIDVNLQREAFEWFHRYRNMYIACDSWYEVSGRDYIEYWDCPGDLLLNWKDKGYTTVFNLLQNKIPVGSEKPIDIESRVLLNKEVTKITYNASNAKPNTKVLCSDGSEHYCDHLICTMSLGVLKNRHWTLFEPPLPRHKIDSIESMGFGTVDKIYVEFKKSFWNADWEGISFLWNPEQLKEIHKDSVNGPWLMETLGFYTVSFQPNILCGWITGNAARKMELVGEHDVKLGVEKVLRMFLKNYGQFNVKNVFCTKWSSNPHFLGSYTYYSLNADAVGASTDSLAEPILHRNSKPLIQFAGEATHAHYYSTVHGAVETGWREAQRIIDSYKSTSIEKDIPKLKL